MQLELFHKGIRVALFHIPNARFFPETLEYHLSPNHRRNTCGVADRLAGDFFKALLVVATVIDEDSLFLAVFVTHYIATDAGLTCRPWP